MPATPLYRRLTHLDRLAAAEVNIGTKSSLSILLGDCDCAARPCWVANHFPPLPGAAAAGDFFPRATLPLISNRNINVIQLAGRLANRMWLVGAPQHPVPPHRRFREDFIFNVYEPHYLQDYLLRKAL